MGAGLKKDLRVSRVGPGGSLNAFFFLLIGVISQRLAMVRKKGGTSTLGERSTTKLIIFCGMNGIQIMLFLYSSPSKYITDLSHLWIARVWHPIKKTSPAHLRD
ncbi:hypothetical protein M0R45_030517 [Rubus argutus]|uniref:Vomeronasal type-1 receptor n=1 Tax=Rubus argutus TaxID=59490 RepID=A0AAW1WEY4_RUBAR